MVALTSAVLFASALSAGADLAYTQYINLRYHYAVSYPAAILTPQGEPDAGDGQSFLSKGRDVEMSVWGSYNVLDETIRSRFGDQTRGKNGASLDRKVTFKRLAKNWFVVSGSSGENIFYEKTILEGNVFITVAFSYPAAAKTSWDPILATVSKSLQHSRSSAPR